ncbi:MAG: hypothetical protein ACUVXE_04270 [Anaerolineae bacterium]
MSFRWAEWWRKIFRRSERPAHSAREPESRPAPTELSSPANALLRSAIEHLQEDEALTGDLVDAAADDLLKWAIAQATAVVRQFGATPEAEARLSALRQRTRALARQVGEMPPDEQFSSLQKLLEGESE